MSNMRQKFLVAWDDREPVEIVTSARDFGASQDYLDDPAMATYALVHASLDRLGHDVPKLDDFVDLLDSLDIVNGQTTEVNETPTSAGA